LPVFLNLGSELLDVRRGFKPRLKTKPGLPMLLAASTLLVPSNAMNTPSKTEPEIIQREKFLVMGAQARFRLGAESGEGFATIWRDFEAHREQIQVHSTDQKYYGVRFLTGGEDGFDYLAGMAVRPAQAIPAGLVIREVPAATYAVFACPVAAIGPTKRYIFTQWGSQSGREIDSSGVVFEEYPPAEDTQSPILIHIPLKAANEAKRPMFFPPPLRDDWSRWIVGKWERAGESETGRARVVERIEPALNGQFLICRGEAAITEITPEHAEHLRRNMHASDKEIERFKREGYQSLQLFTVDQTTGEIVGYLFDSLRCVATGRGKREGNREIMEWQWANGHKSTRITERLNEDRMGVIQRTPMPDGSVMVEKGKSVRCAPKTSDEAKRSGE
jgi:predicted transcriptional regulator YdeE